MAGRALLERGDRMTMAASIEARVPFLDHELAAFISSLPDDYRVRGLRGKWILREAGKQLIPERILRRPKVGFRVQVNEWFRGEMREYLLEHLRSASSMTKRYCERQVLDQDLTEHLNGRQNHEKLLWALLNRRISLEKRARRLVIEDTLQMSGAHAIELFFQCSERCQITPTPAGANAFPEAAAGRGGVCTSSLREHRLILGWVSRKFDEKQPAPTIIWRARLAGESILRSEITC